MATRGAYPYGLPEDADDTVRADFTVAYTELYRNKNWKRETLSEYYAEDFKYFTKEKFAALPQAVKPDLRDLLRANGVYVPKERNVIIADAPRQAVEEDLPWPGTESGNGGTTEIENDPDCSNSNREKDKKFHACTGWIKKDLSHRQLDKGVQ